jgi:5,6-dimethylbenzimidazole synthase
MRDFAAKRKLVQNGLEPGKLTMTETEAFNEYERSAVYRVIAERRDVRRGFSSRPIEEDVLRRLLQAAHDAPSVGLMQPSRFIVIRDLAVRTAVHANFERASALAATNYSGERRVRYNSLRLEGILEAPQNICVVCDQRSERGHQLGRHSMQEAAVYSTVCAVQNLWLAARSEGIGVGWVSILNVDTLRSDLKIPSHLLPVAYLCVGYVDHFASKPDLERLGWEQRVPLDSVISYESYCEAESI